MSSNAEWTNQTSASYSFIWENEFMHAILTSKLAEKRSRVTDYIYEPANPALLHLDMFESYRTDTFTLRATVILSACIVLCRQP